MRLFYWNSTMKKRIASPWLWSAGGLTLFIPLQSLASDVQQNNSLDTIVNAFKDQTITWEPIIHNLTLGLFWGLATISFTWCFIQLALKEGTGLVDVLAELTRRTLLIGFSIWMMNEASNLGRVLISSFIKVGTTISGGAVTFSPSNVFELGLNVISIAWKSTSVTEPVNMLMMFFVALIILACFAIMAMEMTILIVSGYIIVSGGIIAMGFLGSEWTRDNAINYFTAVLGVAFKMFIMQLVFIIGYSFVEDWGSAIGAGSSNTDFLALIGICIVFTGLMREIPQMAASLASGRFTMQGGGVQTAATAFAAGAAGAALLTTAMAGMMGGGKEGSSDSPSPESTADSPGAGSLDTGPGDDGAGFTASRQAGTDGNETASGGGSPGGGASADSRVGPSGDTAPSTGDNTAKQGKKRSSPTMAKAGKVAGAALHSVATRTAFGKMLATGASILGEKPVDPTTASAEDVHRQLTASLNANSPPEPGTASTSAFDNNITSAENQHVYDEEKERREQHHAHGEEREDEDHTS